jgi:hypothetical protein
VVITSYLKQKEISKRTPVGKYWLKCPVVAQGDIFLLKRFIYLGSYEN